MKRALSIAALAGIALAAFGYGFFAERQGWFPARQLERVVAVVEHRLGGGPVARDGGLWTRARHAGAGEASPREQVLEIAALPYVSGSRPASSVGGVRVLDREHTAGGVNLFTSGHAPEAYLMDLDGELLHSWRLDPREIWPDLRAVDDGPPFRYMRRVRLLPDGGLLAIYEYRGIVRLDADSRVLWSYRGDSHHDLDVDDRGRVWVLGREVRRIPGIRDRGPVWDEDLRVLDDGGELVQRVSVLECLERSQWAPLLDIARLRDNPDALHVNTLAWLDGSLAGRSPLFRRGNVLISMRNLNTLAIVDPAERRVVWAATGAWLQQHEPVLLPSGRVLLFDNRAGSGRSRAVEFDPFSQQVSWEFSGTDEDPLYSSLQGSVQRLDNGNTLITESDFGRVLEVTPQGRVVWEFVNPHTTGPDGEYVAVVPEMVRLPGDTLIPGVSPGPPHPRSR